MNEIFSHPWEVTADDAEAVEGFRNDFAGLPCAHCGRFVDSHEWAIVNGLRIPVNPRREAV